MQKSKTFSSIFLCFSFLFLCFSAQAQENYKKLKGVVVDKANEAIPYANIQVKNSIITSFAEVDGSFTMNLASLNVTLVFSAVGYQNKEIDLRGESSLNIVLEDKYSELDEAVVVGYGTLQKSVITGAVSSVKNKDFKDQPVVALGNAIQGKLAGVNVVSPSGTPGAGLLFNIRGSFNPLYVVDGIPLSSENNSSLETSYDLSGNAVGKGQSVSSISDINPNDIESIEILKDASAAAIYGARAANGVVLITTKRGNSDRTEFGINHYSGIQERTRTIDFLSSSEMLDLLKDGLAQDKAIYEKNNQTFGNIDPNIFKATFSDAFNPKTNTVWLDNVLQRAGINNTEIYARGGSARTHFHISGNYFNQQGIVINSGFQRMSTRINLDHKVTDKLSLGTTLMLARTLNQRSFNDNTYTGIITNALGSSPFITPRDDADDYTAIDSDSLAIASWVSDNPIKSANEIKATTNTNRVLGSIFGEYKISNDFRFKSSWSLDYTDLLDNQYFSPLTYDAPAEGVNGRGLYSNFKGLNWVAENYFAYTKNIALDHNVSIIVGNSVQQAKARRVSFQGENFPNLASLTEITSAGRVLKRAPINGALGLVSFYGRANYDFKNKLIAAFSFRIDGSSRFAAENRYASFASSSFGYRIISIEDPQSTALITDLKARMSYGVTGDQEIGDFSHTNQYSTGVYNGTATVVPSVLANPNLTWQRNKILNAGIDFELKRGRIAGAIEAFVSNKSGLLFQSRIPSTTGFGSVPSNAGSVRNMGLELTLNGTIINRGRLRWNVSSNLSFIRNEYTALIEDDQIVSAYSDIAPTHILKVGQPVGTFWGIKYTGVDAETGDATFDDVDGNGIIDNNDAQIIGRAFPTMYGGLNTSLNYKRLDIAIASQFSYGNQIYNLIRPAYDNQGWANEGWEQDAKGNYIIKSFYANNSVRMKNRWQKPGDVTDVPRASLVSQNYIEASSMYIEDGSFWRIRTINVGYNFKHRKGFETARLYVQVQNPFLFTKYTGFDPEVSSTGASIGAEQTAGVDYGAYPQARTYTIGINMTF